MSWLEHPAKLFGFYSAWSCSSLKSSPVWLRFRTPGTLPPGDCYGRFPGPGRLAIPCTGTGVAQMRTRKPQDTPSPGQCFHGPLSSMCSTFRQRHGSFLRRGPSLPGIVIGIAEFYGTRTGCSTAIGKEIPLTTQTVVPSARAHERHVSLFMTIHHTDADSTAAPHRQPMQQCKQDQTGGEPAKAEQQSAEPTGQRMGWAVAHAVFSKACDEVGECSNQRQRGAGAPFGQAPGNAPGLAGRLGLGGGSRLGSGFCAGLVPRIGLGGFGGGTTAAP